MTLTRVYGKQMFQDMYNSFQHFLRTRNVSKQAYQIGDMSGIKTLEPVYEVPSFHVVNIPLDSFLHMCYFILPLLAANQTFAMI